MPRIGHSGVEQSRTVNCLVKFMNLSDLVYKVEIFFTMDGHDKSKGEIKIT